MLRTLSIIIISGILLASCKRDFLNTRPLGEIESSLVWSDGPLAEAFINNIYTGLGQGGFNEEQLASASDEAVFTHAGRGFNILNEGTLNPTSQGWLNGPFEWNGMFRIIRNANLALEKLATATFPDAALNKRLRGESHFLRAYYYHQLLRFYGSVPIISKTYGLNEDYSVARNTFDENVSFILKECDSAAILLNGTAMGKGRANRLAALALESRVLLYAASDLHDVPTLKANSTVLAAFAKPELLGYVTGTRAERWQKAKAAAKLVMDASSGYKLTLTAPENSTAGRNNYLSIAMGGKSKAPEADAAAESELIFARYFVPNQPEGAQQQGLYNGPNGYHCWAGNSPMQLIVDDYEYMDSSVVDAPKSIPFSWNNPVQKAAPFVNRDPRFYATILFDGATWKPRDKISGNVDPANQIQVGQYQVGASMLAGLDTRQSTIENWNGSWTGYYGRKFVDPDPNIVDNTTRQFVPWPFIRYTEAVLNYVEACIELGEDTEAKIWLNKIRFRAGMPAISETGAALRTRYRNERRIELAYEEHRYHDARRWMIAPTTLGRKLVYMSVSAMLKPGATAPSPYRKDDSRYNYTYTPVEDNSLENRKWDDKMYYRPISRDEVNKNPKLVQNPGY
ncbi:MAG: RagB/SusD family nutrient uptake outer membrane protein [Chitinophagaceae bacterium]